MTTFKLKLILFFVLVTALQAFSQNHILLTEIGNGFKKAFIEVNNPTAEDIDLTHYYITNDTAYYHYSDSVYTPSSSSFLAQFPAGSILKAGETKVIAFFESNFESEFNVKADFELFSSDDGNIPDMTYEGSKLNKFGVPDFVMAFYWDGVSDLVKDVDYITWSTGSAKVIDKTNKPGANHVHYRDDTPEANQRIYGYTLDFERIGPVDLDQRNNGNGITGEDETSENMPAAWAEQSNPSPGVFTASGRGKIALEQFLYDAGQNNQELTLNFMAPEYFAVEAIKIVIPGGADGLSWSQSSSDIDLSGEALGGTENISVDADTIIISNGSFSNEKKLTIRLTGFTTPESNQTLPLSVFTRGLNDEFRSLATSPTILITESVSIAEIQLNYNNWAGKTVTISGIITVGVNTIQTGRTNVFLQDQSGRGINLSSSTIYTSLVRGAQVVVTGEVGEYNDVTQITIDNVNLLSNDNTLPAAAELSTRDANDFDEYDGTWIRCNGVVEGLSEAGGGANIDINDGSGPLLVRIWNSTGIELTGLGVGDTLKVHGVLGTYSGEAQLLPSLQEDVEIRKPGIEGDGTGTLTLLSTATLPANTAQDISFKFTAGDYDLGQIYIYPSAGITYSVDQIEISPAGYEVSATSNNGFRLRSGVNAHSEITITLKNALVPNKMHVRKYQDGVSSAIDTTVSIPVNQKLPIFSNTAVGGTGSQRLPLSAYLTLQTGTGTRTLIADIQNHFSYYNGKSVTVTGRMTISAGTLRNDQTSAYVQDESGRGLNVYNSSLNSSLTRGSEVTFSGSITEYNGVTELAYSSATPGDLTKLVPPAKILNTLDGSDFSRYDGTYIEVRGILDDIAYAIGGGTNIVVSDPFSSLTVRVWETTEPFLNTDIYTLNLQDSIFVKGALGVYNGTAQLLPAEGDDILSKHAPTAPLELNLPGRPFAPDRGEKLKIEYGAGIKKAHIRLRLYNTAGKLILVLKDETFSSSKRTFYWDGRDNNGVLIPVGVYILHLEVVNHDGRNRSGKIAPVVIGTKLN